MKMEHVARGFLMDCPLFWKTMGNENYTLAEIQIKGYFCRVNWVTRRCGLLA